MNDLEEIHSFPDEVLEDNATVNGWVLDNLGKIPEVGDHFEFENLSVEVMKVDGRRAAEIRLTIRPEEDEDDEDNDRADSDSDRSERSGKDAKESKVKVRASKND